ncbi:hypothetical protein A0130_15655 [Leifsonia xyli]|uniref:stage II sporulation protein M n=1 Tax=Leifsonia xyli TaxID=1575 RepID=UPI0007CDF025|nr:hypothetical protein A0130_15655 [Leifsonia xyli]
MDLDAYTAARSADWEELSRLAAKRRLDGAEADRLIDLYQSGAADLSALQTSAGATTAGDRLSLALSNARLRFTGAGANLFAQLPRFFVLQLPAALYRLRWIVLAVALATAVIATLYALWITGNPDVLRNLGDDANLRRYVEHDFIDYYSNNPAASFAGQVWTNNAWIAAQCIAFGITGLYVPYVLIQNAVGVGTAAGVMFAYGRGDVLFSYIVPHGLLELTSVFVAAAAGLRIFWAWIAPGARTRGQALAEDGRALFTVAVGCAISLFVSGLIEGFVTPSGLPVWAKIGIGALALAAFLTYMLVLGRRAVRAGETGDLTEYEAGTRRIVAG